MGRRSIIYQNKLEKTVEKLYFDERQTLDKIAKIMNLRRVELAGKLRSAVSLAFSTSPRRFVR